MVLQWPEAAQSLGNGLQRLDPLAEHDRLLAAGGHFLQVGLQSFQLAADAGHRIEVADLLESQHQFEHMLDRQCLAHAGQLHDAFVLGRTVGVPLRAVKSSSASRYSLGGRSVSTWSLVRRRT